jgi:hypothetical protein
MLHASFLAVHITAGSTGVLLGPFALRAALRGGRRTRTTAAYVGAVTVLTVSAVALAMMRWHALWPFALIAVATEAAVAGAWRVADRRRPGWLPHYVRLLCGSYVSLVTALLVVSWGTLLAWVLPSIAGVALVERAAARAGAEEWRLTPTT